MNKKISLLLSCVLIGTSIGGCSNGFVKSDEDISVKVEKVKNLDFKYDVNPKNFQISVDVDGKKETISEPMKEKSVTNLKKKDDEISWTYPDEHINVGIKKKNDYLDVDIKSTNKEVNSFTWPSISGESYVLPINEGKFIPGNDKYWKDYLNEQKLNTIESLSMQFFSVNKDNFAATYIMKNKFNNELKFDTKNNIKFDFNHEYTSINKNKEYGFRIYITDKNVNDVVKNYKNYVIENKEFKTLAQKAKENKNIEKLYGAPQIYFWDKSIITDTNIKWNLLRENMNDEFITWIKELLNTKVEGGKEISNVLDTIKNQDYVDKYQKQTIVNGFNAVMMLKEFYNPNVFKNLNTETQDIVKRGVNNLNRNELIALNKELLKSELKDATTPTNYWARNNTIDVLDDMKKSGIDNAWIGFDDLEAGYVSPEFVKKANDYGYLVGPYDSYHSIHKPGEEKWSTAKFEDKLLYENATIEDKNGKKLEGFQGTGRKLNPTLSMSSVKSRVNKTLKEGYKFNTWFIDCDATGEIYDDYSKNHPTTQEQDLNARLKRISYIRDDKNMVVGSEGGNDFASTTIAFAHGLETPAFSWIDPDMNKNKDSEYYVGRYYAPNGGAPEVFAKQIPVKDQYKKIFVDPTYSLPLFRLVYNDSVVTSDHWLWGTFKIKDEVGNRMMKNILYNTAPMYHLDKNEWTKYKKDILSHDKVWSDFNKKAIREPMTEFKYLSDDRLVQTTAFGDDLRVVANFSNKDFKYKTDIVKANSLIIYDKNKKTVYKPQ
ncbi:glycoside hydrolase [Paraclostridium ghonii]|uniref:glycoside hydrolase n=1 Tax=Paraclostridium ghonii TaxID=29358 RepID=UPI003525ABDD